MIKIHEKSHSINQRNKDFSGQDLTGYDFSGCDIRGSNFENAILNRADFSQTISGLSLSWTIVSILVVFVISFFGGLISGYSSSLLGNIWVSTSQGFIFGTISIIILFYFFTIILLKGFGSLLTISLEIVIAFLIFFIVLLPPSNSELSTDAQFSILVISGNLAGAINIAVGISISRFIALYKPKFLISFLGTLGVFLGVMLAGENQVSHVIALPIAQASILIGEVAGWLAFSGKIEYGLIYFIAVSIVTKGGTSFRNASLNNANFDRALLKNTDFRDAKMTHASWFQVCGLEQARTDGTYLVNARVQQLVVTRIGKSENFDHCDLRGLNLQNSDLKSISLIGTDLSDTNLVNADLSMAKLVQTQLYRSKLTGACLTGAYIQDWAISTDTDLQDVKCAYIFMRLPTDDNPQPRRKPDNEQEIFHEGDFADFIAPIIKTLSLYGQQNVDPRQFKSLDFYHYGGIDPAAAAIALKQLAQENPDAGLEVVALEGRGNDKIRLQATILGEANSSQLNAKYFEKYRQISSLPYRDIQALLAGAAEKDERIRSLERLLENSLQQPKFYVETYQNQGGFIMSQSKGNVNISGVQGNVSGIAAAGENQTMTGVAIGVISGTVTNTINQLPASPDPDNPGIKELLAKLQEAIEAESELPDADKAEALEQVKTLAEAGQKPEDNVLQKAAKTSLKILKGTVASLPDATKLVEACTKLLPAIATLLALV
jgi:uncharacterized protein YjbI with pentapeptide repeats